jgi:23S rRNA (adenine2030-N6)-methyltransferase
MQMLSRPQDRMTFCELHPEEYARLMKAAGRDRRAKAMEMDGWQALKALLPPPERRGTILIDPPYEDPAEFRTAADAIAEAVRRFATGIYLVWYPVKNRHDTAAAVRRIARAGAAPALKLELEIAPPKADGPLTASGLLAINPPWKLREECAVMLPALRDVLAGENRGAVQIEPME